ncbi:MAG: hypothetical protein V4609_17820 [Pseudomonadota bacterium]
MRHDTIELESTDAAGLSLEACDDAEGPPPHDSDPSARIARFCQLMLAQGRVVTPAVMLADREYAMWQLARARASDDAQLRGLAGQLFTWLDEREHARESR